MCFRNFKAWITWNWWRADVTLLPESADISKCEEKTSGTQKYSVYCHKNQRNPANICSWDRSRFGQNNSHSSQPLKISSCNQMKTFRWLSYISVNARPQTAEWSNRTQMLPTDACRPWLIIVYEGLRPPKNSWGTSVSRCAPKTTEKSSVSLRHDDFRLTWRVNDVAVRDDGAMFPLWM